MIELAKLTGEMEDGSIRVQMRTGEHLYALLVTHGTMGLPSETWIEENKDNFLAVIDYVNDDDSDPLCMGFLPVQSAQSDSFGIINRLLKQMITLVDKLSAGKVNTQIGPQPFMPNTQQALSSIKNELENIEKLLLKKQ